MVKTRRTRPPMIGLCFTTPVTIAVTVHAMGMPALIVSSETRRIDVRNAVKASRKNNPTLFIVDQLVHLPKLGTKATRRIRVAIVDTPDKLEMFDGQIQIIDAHRDPSPGKGLGEWRYNKDFQIPTLQAGIRKSPYGYPLTSQEISAANASFTVQDLPATPRKYDPITEIKAVVLALATKHRVAYLTTVCAYLAGLIGTRTFRAETRKATTNLGSGNNKRDWKKQVATLRGWIEDDNRGRRVTSAYQLVAKKKKSVAAATAFVEAHPSVLGLIMTKIPPSSRQSFQGWTYNARRAALLDAKRNLKSKKPMPADAH